MPQPPQAEAGVNPNLPIPETNQQTEAHNMELPATQAPAAVVPAQAPSGMAGPVPASDAGQMAGPMQAQPVAPQVTDVPLEAEDSDLIEKAWVEKAKAIVEQTKDDPYLQNKEINRVKASYIKKRYNKDIKLNEDQKQ